MYKICYEMLQLRYKEYKIHERCPYVKYTYTHFQQLQHIWQNNSLLVSQSHKCTISKRFRSAHINSLVETPGCQEAFWFPCLPTFVI